MRRIAALAGAGLLAFVVTACGTSSGGSDKASGDSSGFTAPDVAMATSLGQPEGQVNILAWPGYAEDGSNDPKVDWVTPFEKKTGCQVNVKEFGTSDEAVSLMHAGGYDVVSASGDATLRLIAAGDVQPVNTELVPNYADISPFLKQTDYNSVAGQMYGIPHGWGANLLAYNTDVVKPPPSDWGAVFDGASQYAGKVTAYDNPIYIADAALYLMNTKPDLGITNPYSLDQDQLDAAVQVLKDQNKNIGEYWTDYAKEAQAFKTGSTVIGTSWEYTASISGPNVKTAFPDSGSTGWSDTWMVSSDNEH
ncbi:MAG: extracellular solute-binding protein, partial [Friedmanniella sp.]